MYIPKYFKVEDPKEVADFLHHNSFGTLFSTHEGMPMATHIPLELEERDGKYYVTGHMAYANPQWRHFQNQTVLAVFQGVHSYVSSSWYDHVNVPTWNYTAVHVYGQVTLADDERLKEMLISMLAKYESHREKPVLWETLPKDFLDSELKGIVGFEIEVTKIEAAFKLSQNRNDRDYAAIISHLEQSEKGNEREVAEVMKQIREKCKHTN